MKTKIKIITAVISVGIMAALTFGMADDIKIIGTQQKLAEEIFRFHVLANSDSIEDQNLKIAVKDHIVAYMKSRIPDAKSMDETKQWAKTHLSDIETEAGKVIRENGYDYKVNAEVRKCEFPDKTYGDLTFPAGVYEALRITIGNGRGRNWWCVLYPSLCFLDSVHAVVPKEGKEKLRKELTVEEYEMITTRNTFRLKCFFLRNK